MQQKVKVFRAADPLVGVFLWGVAHSVRPGPPVAPSEPLRLLCLGAPLTPGSRLRCPSSCHFPRRAALFPAHQPPAVSSHSRLSPSPQTCLPRHPLLIHASSAFPARPPAPGLAAGSGHSPGLRRPAGPGSSRKDFRGRGLLGWWRGLCERVWKGSREGSWIREGSWMAGGSWMGGVVHFPFHLTFQLASLTLEPWLCGKLQASRTF